MNTISQKLQPLKKENRILFLDILRGIAILFIFTANIPYLSGYFMLSDEQIQTFSTAKFDEYFDFVMFTLVDGKFYSIFSLLFGIGFVIQFNNLKKHNLPFVPFFRKRMFWLLLIGLCHLFFIWIGDILTLYALLGFVLILFRNHTDKQLLKWSVILIIFPVFHWLFIYITEWNYPNAVFGLYGQYWESLNLPMQDFGNGNVRPNEAYFFGTTSLQEFFKIKLGRPLLRLGMILNEGRAFKVLGIFLIGIWSGRKILNENILSDSKLLKKIALWGFIIGLPVSIFRTTIDFFIEGNHFWEFMNYVTYALGTVPLAIAYTASVALACQNKTTILKWFAPVGQMALSSYIFQTFISVFIFHGIGLGHRGEFSFSAIIAITIGIFIVQILFCRWWLSKFKYGQLEWVWRQLTYGKFITLKK